MGNNTNAEGFSFMDMLSFSGGPAERRAGKMARMTITSNDPSLGGFAGGNNNNSIRTIWGGGINYNNIIGTKTDFYQQLLLQPL